MTTTALPPQPCARGSGGAESGSNQTVVVPLNAAGALFAALADGIRGSARDWPPAAVAKLEQGLFERYGAELGGVEPVRQLVAIATDHEPA